VLGQTADYNRDVALDVVQLLALLQATQPEAVETLNLAADGIQRTQFLHWLQGEITKRGVVDAGLFNARVLGRPAVGRS